eukprot:scaffold53872_cov69-Phaeocystis_antarctica.AAC.3
MLYFKIDRDRMIRNKYQCNTGEAGAEYPLQPAFGPHAQLGSLTAHSLVRAGERHKTARARDSWRHRRLRRPGIVDFGINRFDAAPTK